MFRLEWVIAFSLTQQKWILVFMKYIKNDFELLTNSYTKVWILLRKVLYKTYRARAKQSGEEDTDQGRYSDNALSQLRKIFMGQYCIVKEIVTPAVIKYF